MKMFIYSSDTCIQCIGIAVELTVQDKIWKQQFAVHESGMSPGKQCDYLELNPVQQSSPTMFNRMWTVFGSSHCSGHIVSS